MSERRKYLTEKERSGRLKNFNLPNVGLKMKPMKQHPEREISPITERNFYYAHSHEISLWWNALLFVNFWTDRFRFFPHIETEYRVPWWELKTSISNVNIIRIYWLRFGMAYVSDAGR